MAQLEHERGGIDRLVSNRALYEMAAARADRSDPLVRQTMARLETGYRLGRILVTREVLRQAPAGFSAATKCFCTEHEIDVAEFVFEVFGAEGMLWSDVTRGLVYAPGYTIMGGTSNVMRNILGERVLGLPTCRQRLSSPRFDIDGATIAALRWPDGTARRRRADGRRHPRHHRQRVVVGSGRPPAERRIDLVAVDLRGRGRSWTAARARSGSVSTPTTSPP